MEEFSEVLLDVQKEYKRSNKLKDIIIIILIVLMFLQSALVLVVLFGMSHNLIMWQQMEKMLMLKQVEIMQMQNTTM